MMGSLYGEVSVVLRTVLLWGVCEDGGLIGHRVRSYQSALTTQGHGQSMFMPLPQGQHCGHWSSRETLMWSSDPIPTPYVNLNAPQCDSLSKGPEVLCNHGL